MTDWIEEVLARYGQSVTLGDAAGGETVRAFLQPVTERGETVPDAVTPIGWMDGRLWLYLGRTAVEEGDLLLWNGKRFRVRSSRAYAIGETVAYWWASLEQAKEAAE